MLEMDTVMGQYEHKAVEKRVRLKRMVCHHENVYGHEKRNPLPWIADKASVSFFFCHADRERQKEEHP